MWWGSGQDPGGSEGEGPSKEPPPNPQLQDLQEQFESQQMLIAQLKEMLKKTEQSNVSREKVEEYASTLSKMNARAKRGKLRKSEGTKTEDETITNPEITKEVSGKKSIVTPQKEKVNLLRQQLEENRLKLAQRDKNQKGIEEMVNQLKAQLDDSQIMINQSTLNLSKLENKPVPQTSYSADTSKDDLISLLQNKDKYIEELNIKMQQLQGNVLDLQENLKEKDSVIDARTKAITLLSENLSKKGKNTLDMLDETKVQMRDMQEQFVTLELKMKEENAKLLLDLDEKKRELEDFHLSNNSLVQEKNLLESSNNSLQEKLESAITELNNCKLELSSSELKVQELTRVNHELERRNSISTTLDKSERSASSSPQRDGKQKSKTSKKSKQKTETPSESEHLSRIRELETLVEQLKSESEKISKKNESEENTEVKNLKTQLDTMNKNLIKTKAQYKAKLKELQKKTAPGEVNEKLINLESENVKLEQRVAELEDEKGNLQLRLVDVDSSKDKEHIADLENKIEDQKMEIENHIRIITALETQITDKSNEISTLRNELANLTHIENAQVCSEITSVQLEEQLDKQALQKKELEDKFEDIKKENEKLEEKIDELNKEKQEMNTKLVNYMQENMELIDRLEKLSAEKVSSAESIEIVESLTQQEKLELEAYQKNLEFTSDKEHIEQSDIDPGSDLNESVSKLTEDSSELLERIELFTVERREVMEKMESLLSEKEHLLGRLNTLENEKRELIQTYDSEKENLLHQIQLLSQQDNQEKCDVIDGIRMDSASNTALVEEYKILLDNQKIEIEQLKQELLRVCEENSQIPIQQNNLTKLSVEKEGLEIIVASLNDQFFNLHKEYESFFEEHKKLKDELKKNSETVYEKDSSEEDFRVLKHKLAECENKIKEDAEEIKILQTIVEDNKNELIKSADYIASLTSELSVKHSELSDCKNEVEQLQIIIQQLNSEVEQKNNNCQEHIETIDALSLQLQDLKTLMDNNFEELHKYEELDNRITEAGQLINLKDSEILRLREEISINQDRIVALENELKHKDENFKESVEQLRNQCLTLESRIQANSGSLDDIKGPFEVKIQELENECKKLECKHKEHVDKMKKIAANLKKKAVTCQKLEEKLAEVNEKWENECKEKNEKEKCIEEQRVMLDENKNKIDSLMQQLQETENVLHNLQTEFEHKNSEYGQLKMDYNEQLQQFENDKTKLQNELAQHIATNNELQTDNNNYKAEITKLNSDIDMMKSDSDLKQNDLIVQSLHQQIEDLQLNFNTANNALQAKIQEKELYIENLESENVVIKERLAKLNEGLAQVEERRHSLELQTLQLGAELEAKENTCEEMLLFENILEKRLTSLKSHDEAVESKLKDMTAENQKLTEDIENLNKNNTSLQMKLSEFEIKLKEKENECEKMFHLESDSVQLREVISSLEHDVKKLHMDYEKKLFEKSAELESTEQELNNQITELTEQRKIAINECEIYNEKIQEFCDNEQVLQNEIENLREKLNNMKVDLDKQLEEYEKLNEINSVNLLTIQQLKNELSTTHLNDNDLQNMHSEITRLQKVVAEKDNDIQNYQRQNMQLQMSMNTPSSLSFPAVSFSSESQDDAALLKQIHDLTNEVKVYKQKISEFEKINVDLYGKIEEYNKCIVDLQDELSHHKGLLVRKTAEEKVDEILCTAQQLVETKEETIEKEAVQEPSIEQTVIREVHAANFEEPKETKEEELLKKIKALEFMLYNVEKEKDDAVSQCHSLSNELTRLIYEREGLIGGKKKEIDNREVDLDKLDAEIILDTNVDDNDKTKQELKDLEYTPVEKSTFKTSESTGQQEPVDEMITKKSTYLCFADDKKAPADEASGWGVEDDILKASLESQIVQEKDIPISKQERKDLQQLEYEDVLISTVVQHDKPVEEKIKDPKHAYLCYPEEKGDKKSEVPEAIGWGHEDEVLKATLESQIVQDKDIPISKQERRDLQHVEFEDVLMSSLAQHDKPVEEKVKDPKHAYLCYPDENVNIGAQDAFASEEDGWGWNAEEVKLEAKHQQSLFTQPPAHSEAEQRLKEKIQNLEAEKNKLLDDIKSHQIKSAKLVKKLKELKVKNDSLTAQLQQKSQSDFDVLDMAIQDELNTQIKKLETKLKEISEEKNKEKVEKDNLLKRIDVLTSANERMIEMKEKQDNEIQMLQFNNRQLSTKLENMEWGQDSPKKEPDNQENIPKLGGDVDNKDYEALVNKVEELNRIINDLTIDNEEMQLLLEEQRKLRIDAEKTLASQPMQENMKTEQEYMQLKTEKDEINNKLLTMLSENNKLHEKIKYFCDLSDDSLCPRLDSIQEQVTTLMKQKETLLLQYTKNIEELQVENKKLHEQVNSMVSEVETLALQNKDILESELTRLKDKITTLEQQNQELQLSLTEKESKIVELSDLVNKLTTDKSNLEFKLREISGVICTENADQLEGLSERLEIIVNEMQNKNKEVSELNNILSLERAEFEQKLTVTLEQLAQEWAERVEQRGSDVAESWKLHVETRENEFAELEQTLRSELSEIYNKNESLLVENNELQKKVELLSIEKQAASSDNKVEALQEILSERQSEIITLSQQLQDVSVQLEVKNNEIISLQQIIDSMQKQNYDLTEKNKDLHINFKNYEQLCKQLETENKDVKKFSRQNEELNAQLKIENQEIEILKQTTEGLQQELYKIRDELSKEKAKHVESENKVVELQEDIQKQEIKMQEIIKLLDGETYEPFEDSDSLILHLEEKILNVIKNLHDLRMVKDQLSNERVTLEESSVQMSESVVHYQQINEKLLTELSQLRETTRRLEIDLHESTEARNTDIKEMNNKVKEVEEKYKEEINSKTVEVEKMQKQIEQYQTQNDQQKINLEHELQAKVNEMTNLQSEVENLQKQIQQEAEEKSNLKVQFETKLIEVNSLHLEVENLQKQIQQEDQEKSNLKFELEANVSKVNDLNFEVENLQKQNQEDAVTHEAENANLWQQLQSKSLEIEEMNRKIDELDTSLNQGTAQVTYYQQLLEQQTQEISNLKYELQKKTEDYLSICEQLETLIVQQQQMKTPEKHVHFREPISESKMHSQTYSKNKEQESAQKTDPDATVSRAELDIALYMLHQRDVRCEELTVELMQLLEERDTLQLRLSNAIRINEELRHKLNPQKVDKPYPEEMNTPKVLQQTGAIPKSKSSDILLKATGTELATEATEVEGLDKSTIEEKKQIDNKISQLRSVGYRDKTLQDDQEIRYLQQMSIMQQHRDIASRLPPEAAAKLVDASYTLSRDVQSPSKVILNWLWGKSTPKVNDV